MQIKIFDVPTYASFDATEDLNKFLRGNKILNVEQKMIQTEHSAYWSFCVRYIEGFQSEKSKNKTDYMSILDEKEFKRFSILRELRKQIAASEAVQAYMVFTDEELSEISKMTELNASKMISIKGIGDKKVERFGHKIIEMFKEREQNSNETSI
jgi:superfamily II DNA helicase RecQ